MDRAKQSYTHRTASILVLLLMLNVFAWSSALTGWTTVGSAGTVDEDALSIVSLRGPFADLRFNCILAILGIQAWCRVATGLVVVRYNIVPTGALNVTPPPPFVPLVFNARFRDAGPNHHVVLLLKEVSLQSGAETTILTLDSDAFPPSTTYQNQTGPRPCAFTVNFDQNAYYVEAQISNSSGTGSTPGLEAIWISRCPEA